MHVISSNVFVLFAALTGLFVSLHIHKEKSSGMPLVCPLHANCDAVVHSEYSHILSLPLEHIGTVYFGLIAASRVALFFYPTVTSILAKPVIVLASIALLFSIYLSAVQLVHLKEKCSWCFLSAIMTLAIVLGLVFPSMPLN